MNDSSGRGPSNCSCPKLRKLQRQYSRIADTCRAWRGALTWLQAQPKMPANGSFLPRSGHSFDIPPVRIRPAGIEGKCLALRWSHPTGFLIFALTGIPLVAVGILVFLYSLVAVREKGCSCSRMTYHWLSVF